MQLTLSIVIPTYNRRDSLQRSLEGLARQDYPFAQFEVIVVSDGSTDGTDVLLAEQEKRLPYRLRWTTQTNAGPARARNNGIFTAEGDIVVFLDDDVEPKPNFLSVHAAHHEKDSHIVVIGPMLPDPTRRSEEPVWVAWEHAMLEKQYNNWRTGVWPGAGPNHFYSGNASVRRQYLLVVGGFDETFKRQEDVEMAYRLERECGVRFCFDENAAGLHRPSRTFTSWFKVPLAYGRLDVVRAQRGDLSWEIVQHGYRSRNLLTRFFASLSLAFPPLTSLNYAFWEGMARFTYLLGLHRLALPALSVLYNLRYLEGVREEMGSAQAARRIIYQKAVSSSPSSQG